MVRKIEKSAKSKEEALKLAAEELGVSVEEISYKVERETGKGIMGLLLGKETFISAWITKEAEEEEAKLRKLAKMRAESEKTENAADGGVSNPYAPKDEPEYKDYVGPEGRKKKPSAKLSESKKTISEDKQPAADSESNSVVSDDVKAEPHKPARSQKKREVTEKSLNDAAYFAAELVHRMGLSDAEVNVTKKDETVDVNVSGSKMGLLIGKRGDTLDAVQYLTSLYVNKEKNSYIKVNVDTEGYRAKREGTLVRLAKGLERRVARENKSAMLEPMSPNERRIIHAALQDSRDVQTYSIGEEPNRKVVVAPKEEVREN